MTLYAVFISYIVKNMLKTLNYISCENAKTLFCIT